MEKRLELDPGDLVTAKMLRRAGACYSGLAAFRDVFPDGLELTLESLHKAADAGLDVDWFGVALCGAGSDYDLEMATWANKNPNADDAEYGRTAADILWSHL